MAEVSGEVRSVDWQETLPGLRLFSAIRIALSFKVLVLAALALVLSAAGWKVCGKAFASSDDPALRRNIAIIDAWPWEDDAMMPPWDEFNSVEKLIEQSPLVVVWNKIADPFQAVFSESVTAIHFVYLLCCSLWSLLVWALFGGAISRFAAVRIARGEHPSVGALLGFARSRLGSYVAAPLFPLLGAFLAAGVLALAGFVMRSDAGLLVVGSLWVVVLFFGFLMAFLLLGLFFSWPLMWGAISAEGTDSFGALSHSYSYSYQRPLHYLVYVVMAAMIGILGWFLISLFGTYIISLSNWGISWGTGAERFKQIADGTSLSPWGEWGLTLVGFWHGCLLMLVAAFAYSYFWSAATVIYFLLRRLVDATEYDEVFMLEEQALHGLPPLKSGPGGVAQVADEADESDQAPSTTA